MNRLAKIFPVIIVAFGFYACSNDEFDYDPDVVELDGIKAYIAPYYGNKTAAITLTFDDGNYNQYELAVPQLEQRNLPATFFINGHSIKPITSPSDNHMDEACVRDMSQRGFEVSNHTWSHVKLTSMSLEEARYDLAKNDSAIEAWTGIRPTTMSFPNNARTSELIAMAKEGRVGVRTFETGFGQTLRRNTYSDLKKWADEALANKQWTVAMYHGINKGYDYWEDPNVLWQFFDYLTTLRDQVWIANFHDAVSYMTERDSSKLDLYKDGEGDILARLSTTLDTELYKQPLTIVVVNSGVTQLYDILPNNNVLICKEN